MKKIIIPLPDFKDALKRVKPAVPTKGATPSLASLLFEVTAAELKVTATDLDITIQYLFTSHRIAEGSEESFSGLIPFELLNSIIGLSTENITIELKESTDKEGKETTLIDLYTGEDYYCLGKMEELKSFPSVPGIPKRKSIALTPDFIDTINKATACVSRNEFDTAKGNVCIDAGKDNIVIVSTDGNILFSKSFAFENAHEENLLISPKVAKILDGKETAMLWNEKIIAFQAENVIVSARRIDQTFPAWRTIMPAEFNGHMNVAKRQLELALEKCNLNNTELKQTSFKINAEQLLLESTSLADSLTIKTSMPATHEGTVSDICFNSKKLLTLLHTIKAKEATTELQLKFSMISYTKPTIISLENDETYKLLIMPINLN